MRNWSGVEYLVLLIDFFFSSRILYAFVTNKTKTLIGNTRSEVLSGIGVLTAQVLLEIS